MGSRWNCWLHSDFIFVRMELVFIFRWTIHAFKNVRELHQCWSFWIIELMILWLKINIKVGLVDFWKTGILWFNNLFKWTALWFKPYWLIIILYIKVWRIHIRLLNFIIECALIAGLIILNRRIVVGNLNFIY